MNRDGRNISVTVNIGVLQLLRDFFLHMYKHTIFNPNAISWHIFYNLIFLLL